MFGEGRGVIWVMPKRKHSFLHAPQGCTLYVHTVHCSEVKVQCAQCTGGLDLGAGGRKDKRMKALQEVTKRANKSINLPIHALSLLQLRLIVCQN